MLWYLPVCMGFQWNLVYQVDPPLDDGNLNPGIPQYKCEPTGTSALNVMKGFIPDTM